MRTKKLGSASVGVALLILCLAVGTSVVCVFWSEAQAAPEKSLVAEGAEVFANACSRCHSSTSTKGKMAPGLKGLFQRAKLPVSGKPVTEQNVRNQLVNPYKNMPAMKALERSKGDAIIAYLKTL